MYKIKRLLYNLNINFLIFLIFIVSSIYSFYVCYINYCETCKRTLENDCFNNIKKIEGGIELAQMEEKFEVSNLETINCNFKELYWKCPGKTAKSNDIIISIMKANNIKECPSKGRYIIHLISPIDGCSIELITAEQIEWGKKQQIGIQCTYHNFHTSPWIGP